MDSNSESGFSKYTNFITKIFGFTQTKNMLKEETKIEMPSSNDLSIGSNEAIFNETKIIKSLVLDFSNICKDNQQLSSLYKSEFKIDVIDQCLTWGWLVWEVMRKYVDFISEIESKTNTKIKKKLIVAIKIYDDKSYNDELSPNDWYNESLNYWVTQYERSLEPLKEGQIIVPHFSKYLPNRK